MCQLKTSWWIPSERLYDNLRDINTKIDYFPVKLCKSCNRVWEEPLKFSELFRKGNRLRYLDDFPTYGIERKVCYACIEEKRTKRNAKRRKKRKHEKNG
jgi:hypothetical protein